MKITPERIQPCSGMCVGFFDFQANTVTQEEALDKESLSTKEMEGKGWYFG